MTDEPQAGTEAEPQRPTGDPQAAVNLRSDPPKVMRLSRKAIGVATAVTTAFVGGALIYALRPEGQKKAEELYNTDSRNAADSLANGPKDYGQVPKLGAPLPGDLGKPILDAQQNGAIAALPPVGVGTASPEIAAQQRSEQEREAVRQRLKQEQDSAREANVFFGGGRGAAVVPSSPALPTLADSPANAAPAIAQQTDSRRAFLDRAQTAARLRPTG